MTRVPDTSPKSMSYSPKTVPYKWLVYFHMQMGDLCNKKRWCMKILSMNSKGREAYFCESITLASQVYSHVLQTQVEVVGNSSDSRLSLPLKEDRGSEGFGPVRQDY